jgi:hypothetical protein
MLWPFRHPDFKANWIRFLGIDSKRVSILNILFPSSHKTSYGEDFDDDGSQASNSLLAEVVVI